MAGLVDRVKNILMSPKEEWLVIDGEPGETREVMQYVAVLAAIPAIAGVIGSLILLGTPFLVFAIITALIGYVMAFVSVYIIAFIIDALAPTFSSEKHFPSALKLAAYSATPSWVAGIFTIIPIVGGIIALLGSLYGLYLLYLGVPVLMRTPQEKTMGYTIVIIVCAIVVALLLGFVIAAIAGIAAVGAFR